MTVYPEAMHEHALECLESGRLQIPQAASDKVAFVEQTSQKLQSSTSAQTHEKLPKLHFQPGPGGAWVDVDVRLPCPVTGLHHFN